LVLQLFCQIYHPFSGGPKNNLPLKNGQLTTSISGQFFSIDGKISKLKENFDKTSNKNQSRGLLIKLTLFILSVDKIKFLQHFLPAF
jgi:hypothetical protein